MIQKKGKGQVLERDWSRYWDADHTISQWCVGCKGTGRQRLMSAGIIPRVSIIRCRKCKGKFRLWYRLGSDSLKEALKVEYGRWNRDGKHKKAVNPDRR